MMPLACMMLTLLKCSLLNSALRWFGRYSLEIYVLQMLVLGIIGNVLMAVDCSSDYLPLIQTLFTFAIVLGLCEPVHKGIDKLIRKIE